MLTACGDDSGLADAGTPDAGDAADAAAPADSGGVDAGLPEVTVFDPNTVGGALTTPASVYGTEPFLTAAKDFDPTTLSDYDDGEFMFESNWEPVPGMLLLDGLGPLFNAESCVACHPPAGRARSVLANGKVGFGLFLRVTAEDGGPHPSLGEQFQPQSIPGVPAEGEVTWEVDAASTDPTLLATSPRLKFTITPAPAEPVHTSARLSPHVVGVGLLEHVPESMILERADPEDADGDGISGRAARPSGPDAPIGRFGWKAMSPTVAFQTSAAFAHDIGITSPASPHDDCTPLQTVCTAQANGGVPEVSQYNVDATAHFLWHQGVPAARRTPGDPKIKLGAQLFQFVGCENCHRASLRTGPADSALLSEQVFHPYSDLLLHDMGPDLADEKGEADAQPAEWRTPPLWAAGLIASGPNARFLHDGRATSIEDAVRWHGGEAADAQAKFLSLSDSDREALLAFVHSL